VNFRSANVPTVAAVRAPLDGCLALVADGDERLVVAGEGSGLTLDPGVVTRLATLASGAATMPREADVACCTERLERWWRHHVAREQLGRLGAQGSLVRGKIAALISGLVAGAPRHTRTALAARAAMARQVLRLPLGVGAERRLAELAQQSAVDEQWLDQLAEIAAKRPVRRRQHDATILAMIVFCQWDGQGATRP